jgi:glycosyltransferase involved in cell wall biosynthesis
MTSEFEIQEPHLVGPSFIDDRRPSVSVIVPTHRRPERLRRLLEALAKQTIRPETFEVIVVDDCSGDETTEMLTALVSQLPYSLRPMQTPANRGPGPARNLGWKAARAPVIAFTDDDCIPDVDWLEAGLRAMNADESLGVVQGDTGPIDPELILKNRRNFCVMVHGPTPYFETCNIFYRKQALTDSGGFGEHYNWWGGWYCEDTIAGWQVLEAGWSRGFTPEAKVLDEVECRSLRWWIEKALVLYIEVEVARKFPAFRNEAYWRPWSPRRHDAAFVLGCIGLLVGLRKPWAALLAAPYIKWRRPAVHQDHFVRECVETVAIDSARTLGILYGAVKHRMVVL